MRSLWSYLKFNKATNANVVKAKNGSVALNGGNTGTIVVNDTHTIKSAVSEVLIAQTATLNKGLSGELQTEIGRQIDHYRDIMNSGRVKEALGLYTELLTHQAKNLQPVFIFRIKANIAICEHLLGKADIAARLLLEACTYAPEDERAVALKAFALIIDNRPNTAIEYGLAALKNHPDNETLASYIIQAVRINYQHSATFENPFSQFPDQLKNSKPVKLAHIHLLASRETEGWLELANEYLSEDPDDLSAKSLVALGIIQHFVSSRQSPNGFKFTAADISELKTASDYLRDYWLEFQSSDRLANSWDLQSIQCLIISFKLTANFDELRELCAYVLSDLSEDQGLIETTAKCLLDIQEPELCRKAITKLQDLDESKKLSFLLNVTSLDWDTLSRYQEFQIAKFDEPFSIQAKIAVYIAKAKKQDSSGKTKLEQLLSSTILDSRCRLLLFQLSYSCGVQTIALLAHSYGSKTSSQDFDVIEFFHYMKLARYLMLWKEIIYRLSAYPDSLENPELKHMLALAYINEQHIRSEAVSFYEELTKAPTGFELLLGIFWYRQKDYAESHRFISLYFESGGKELYGLIILIDMAREKQDIHELQRLFEVHVIDDYDGSPIEWMHVAKALVMASRSEQGLELGHRIYSQNKNAAKVALSYFHLFLNANKTALLTNDLPAGAGCRLKLTCSDGTVVTREVPETIQDDILLNPAGVDPFIKEVLGCKAGHEYQRHKMQGVVVWRLEEVKHKYLDAFQTICETYETQFPDEGGLWSIKTEDGNVQPLLDFIKRQAEADEHFVTTVNDKRIPLGIAAGMRNKNVVEVADLIRMTGDSIYTCVGTHQERDQATATAINYRGKDAVLDTYTAWTAAQLNLGPALAKYFKQVYVTQSTMDSLEQLLREFETHHGAEFSIGWRTGQFVRTVYTKEDVENQLGAFTNKLQALVRNCTIVKFNFPSAVDEVTELLLEFASESIEPFFVAKHNDALLITDDGFSREFATSNYRVMDSVWLQIIVNIAHQDRLMDTLEYSDAILGLCSYKHSAVSISSAVLEMVFQNDSSDDLRDFGFLCMSVGGPNAEQSSHFDLIMRFIINHWLCSYNPTFNQTIERLLYKSHGDAHPSTKAMKATSILLERVRQMPNGVGLLNEMMSMPILRLDKFVHAWWSGHFYS
ncbi:PIN domain-containing protein [Pseudomonas syringae]|uniref:PIN domain-containing protein n=1 Tax=Pseudomonas syringae TaxID=317 RepID=UPI000E328399|nr:hypothetical protein [Pseudomonas syringae]